MAAVPAPRRRLTLGTMIAALRGTLAEKQPGRIVVDVGGVGYEVQVPVSTYYTVGECGAEVALRIHTHVREEAFLLFGFRTGLELELFERLIGINGVGPRLALAVLSGIEPPVTGRGHPDGGRRTTHGHPRGGSEKPPSESHWN